ncbi:MAG: SMC-Scp complex subunit ScpB [Gammaproteobacteria bacterium]
MENEALKNILEAILLAAGRPLTLDQLLAMFAENERPERSQIREALELLQADYEPRGIALVQVGGGYRIQVRETMQPWVARLWEEKPARYSRALLETLSLIAYRQPITRGEIENVRGVAVSTSIIKTLLEREWIHVLGHRDVPGHPAMYGTTRKFLDYFSLKSLSELPALSELRDLGTIGAELELDLSDIPELQLAPANDGPDSEASGEQLSAGSLPESSEDESEPVTTIH